MSRTRELHPLKILASVGAALLVWGLLFAYASSPAQAATITVNSLADDADPNDGECTLREAITAANTDTASGAADAECAAGSGDDVIHFALPGTTPWTVNLTGELPELTTNIELVGPGADQFTVRRDTGGAYRIFTVSSGSVVSISGITISNGLAFNGGGIYNSGRLVLTDSTVRGNAADGQFAGGIHNDGALILRDSTVSDNVAAEFGGGINNFGKAKLIRSTVDSNTVDSATDEFRAGGGINSGGISNTLRVVNSTISGNTITSEMSLGRGGGISNSGSLVWLKNVTLKGNQGTLGANLGSSGPTRVKNTVVANPTGGGDNCAEDAGIIISKGYNLDSGTSCGFTAIGDIQNQNPLLGRLANNGGPTKTHALLEGSPAIDQGNSFRTNTDQRGESRPHDFADIDNAPGGDGSDIGAFEVQPTAN